MDLHHVLHRHWYSSSTVLHRHVRIVKSTVLRLVLNRLASSLVLRTSRGSIVVTVLHRLAWFFVSRFFIRHAFCKSTGHLVNWNHVRSSRSIVKDVVTEQVNNYFRLINYSLIKRKHLSLSNNSWPITLLTD